MNLNELLYDNKNSDEGIAGYHLPTVPNIAMHLLSNATNILHNENLIQSTVKSNILPKELISFDSIQTILIKALTALEAWAS